VSLLWFLLVLRLMEVVSELVGAHKCHLPNFSMSRVVPHGGTTCGTKRGTTRGTIRGTTVVPRLNSQPWAHLTRKISLPEWRPDIQTKERTYNFSCKKNHPSAQVGPWLKDTTDYFTFPPYFRHFRIL